MLSAISELIKITTGFPQITQEKYKFIIKPGNPIKAIQTNDERIYSLAILTNGNIVYIGTHYQDPDDIYSNFVSIAVMTPSGQLIAAKLCECGLLSGDRN